MSPEITNSGLTLERTETADEDARNRFASLQQEDERKVDIWSPVENLPFSDMEALCDNASKGPWERIAVESRFSHTSFVRAPKQIIENDRGPDHAVQVLGDDDYPTKEADERFVAYFHPQRVRGLLAQLRHFRDELHIAKEGLGDR